MSRVLVLLESFDEAYDEQSWHGPNLRGSITRVKVEEASWRPGPNDHNVWEIVLHAAYWKYVVLRRFTGEKRGSFPRKGSDWFTRPTADAAESWPEDVKLLHDIHVKLRACIAELPDSSLDFSPAGSKVTNAQIIRGIALHDVYHAGQIQTLRQQHGARK
jgi:uncharacterized damage-inducible protein DinB